MRACISIAALVVAAVVIDNKRDELLGAAQYFNHLHVVWIAVGAGAELLAVVAFAVVQRQLLRAGGVDAGLVPLTGITFAGTALQNSFPGGAAFASVYAFRQFRRLGADEILATWTLVAVSVLSSVGLALVAGVGLALSGSQAAALDLVWAILAVVGLAALVAGLARKGILGALVLRVIRLTQRLINWPRGHAETLMSETQDRLLAVTPSRRDWAVGLGMATANWAWDCACLATSFLAVGAGVPWRGLLLAYGAAQLAANLPITPGGLGVVEGSLTIALVAYGGGHSSTVAAVLMYRLMSFWGLLLIGWSMVALLAARAPRQPSEQLTEELVA